MNEQNYRRRVLRRSYQLFGFRNFEELHAEYLRLKSFISKRTSVRYDEPYMRYKTVENLHDRLTKEDMNENGKRSRTD